MIDDRNGRVHGPNRVFNLPRSFYGFIFDE